jgi:hypothetical protein
MVMLLGPDVDSSAAGAASPRLHRSRECPQQHACADIDTGGVVCVSRGVSLLSSGNQVP